LPIIARAHSDAEVEHLERLGAQHVIMGEREIAVRMVALAAANAAPQKVRQNGP
jgi:CPA2 family monovalent cation:H+ antiporter-2